MSLLLFLGVFVFGGLGALCRFVLDSAVKRHWRGSVPVGTFLINVLGSFALGLLTAVVAGFAAGAGAGGAGAAAGGGAGGDAVWWHAASTVLGTGFLGGFTTFSTATVELVTQARKGRPGGTLVLGLLQPAVAMAAALLGFALGG